MNRIPFKIRKEFERTEQQWDFLGIPRSTHAGYKTMKWRGGDSLENFEKNKPAGWTKDSISYDHNSHGYRSIDFVADDNFSVASFGCSFTYGTGVPIEYTWPEIFCKSLQDQLCSPVNNFNFGWPATSADRICRMVVKSIPILKPNLVLILLPDRNRCEKYGDDGYTRRLVPSNELWADYYAAWANDYDSKNNFLKNFVFIKTILELHDIPWLFATWDQYMTPLMLKKTKFVDGHRFFPDDFARDGSHPSVKAYTHLAKSFLEKYNQLYT